MSRLALSFWTIAALGIAGCATRYDPTPATAPAASIRTSSGGGSGIVESISLVNVPASAAAGGTQPADASGPYRITARMEDGTVQTVVGNNRAVLVGDRVQILSDGRVERMTPR